MAEHWNREHETDRNAFLALLAPLIVASRTRDFATPELARNQAIVWIMSLGDLPRALLEQGVALLVRAGVGWMPRPDQLRIACAEIVDEHRRAAARVAQQQQADCERCAGLGWADVVDAEGVARVGRCACWTGGQALIAAAGSPIARPALPPAHDEGIV